jgi:hypothetical protein
MGFDSDTKLTEYTSAVTIVTEDVANMWFGGKHGTAEGDAAQAEAVLTGTADIIHPVVGGHAHDGEHADGHAQKIHLVSHVTSQLLNRNLGTEAVDDRTVSKHIHEEDAIPYWVEEDGVRYYKLDLSMLSLGKGGAGAFIEHDSSGDGSDDIIKTTSEDYTSGGLDFVFGSDRLDSHPDFGIGTGVSRIIFDRDKGAFRAGIANFDEWDGFNVGVGSNAFGINNIADGSNSAVSGGDHNINSGSSCIIGAGRYNTLDGQSAIYSIVGAGSSNYLEGQSNAIVAGSTNRIVLEIKDAFIGAGEENEIANGSSYAAIVAGKENKVLHNSVLSMIGAGDENKIGDNQGLAPAIGSIIGAGKKNVIANAEWSAVIAGYNNRILGISGTTECALIGAGFENKIENTLKFSAILGGQYNVINTSNESVIVSGEENRIMTSVPNGAWKSFIGSGRLNMIIADASSAYAAIVSGQDNQIKDSSYSVIASGLDNRVGTPDPFGAGDGTCEGVFIGSGRYNDAQFGTEHSGIVSGESNTFLKAKRGFVGGGENNHILSEVDSKSVLNSGIVSGAGNRIVRPIGGGTGNFGMHFIGAGGNNEILYDLQIGDDFIASAIVSGVNNHILNSSLSFIGAGNDNEIHFDNSNGTNCIIGSGNHNMIVESDFAFIGAGANNKIGETDPLGAGNGMAIASAILSGSSNLLYFGSQHSSISSGDSNVIGRSLGAFIGGGHNNNIAPNGDLLLKYNSISSGSGNFISSTGPDVEDNFIGAGKNNRILATVEADLGSLYNIIGSGDQNVIQSNSYCFIGSGKDNQILSEHPTYHSNYSVIGGGLQNTVRFSPASTIGGGSQNLISVNQPLASPAGNNVVAGGEENRIASLSVVLDGDPANSGFITSSSILGGFKNTILTDNDSTAASIEFAAVISGFENSIINARFAAENPFMLAAPVICGGMHNVIRNTGQHASIVGGSDNLHAPCSSHSLSADAGVNFASIIGAGLHNKIYGSNFSVIVGGGGYKDGASDDGNTIYGGVRAVGIGSVDVSDYNFIGGGRANKIGNPSTANPLAGLIETTPHYNAILHGDGNIMGGLAEGSSAIRHCTILGGLNSLVEWGSDSSMILGSSNVMRLSTLGSTILGTSNVIDAPGSASNLLAGTNLAINNSSDPPSLMEFSYAFGHNSAPADGTTAALMPYDSGAPSGIRNKFVFSIGSWLEGFNVGGFDSGKMAVGINTARPSPAPHGAAAMGLHIVGAPGTGTSPHTPLRMTNLQETDSWSHVLAVDTQVDGNTYLVPLAALAAAAGGGAAAGAFIPTGATVGGTPYNVNTLNFDVTTSSLNNDAGFISAGADISSLNNDANFISAGADISSLINDAGFISAGASISSLVNDANFISTGASISSLNNDANFISTGASISSLNNDANFISAGADISSLSNDANFISTGASISSLNNDANFISTGASISSLNNDANFISAGADISSLNNDANFISTGASISSLNNDANFISAGADISSLNNDANFISAGADISSLNNDANFISGEVGVIMVNLSPEEGAPFFILDDDNPNGGGTINNSIIIINGSEQGEAGLKKLAFNPGQTWGGGGMSFHIKNVTPHVATITAELGGDYFIDTMPQGTVNIQPGAALKIIVVFNQATNQYSFMVI